jgi:hypothetical protein
MSSSDKHSTGGRAQEPSIDKQAVSDSLDAPEVRAGRLRRSAKHQEQGNSTNDAHRCNFCKSLSARSSIVGETPA